jgi:hypothetical protein
MRWQLDPRRIVRPDFVVALGPTGSHLPDHVEPLKQKSVQHLFAVGPVEALDIGELIGLARLNGTQLDVLLRALVGECVAGQFCGVVAAMAAGRAGW